MMGWLTPVVWFVVAAIIGVVVFSGATGSSSSNGKGFFYNTGQQFTHGWFASMVFHPTSAAQKVLVMILVIVLFIVVMGAILWLVDHTRVPNGTVVAGFLGPAVIALAGGLLYPAISTIIASFRKVNAAGDPAGFNGLANYTHFFNSANIPIFYNTIAWIVLVPLFATAFGLVYAMLVDRTRFEAAAKALIFLPTAISMVAAAIMWRYIYYQPSSQGNGQVGLLNAVWTAFGGSPTNWLIKWPVSTGAMIVVMIWIQAGLAMTLLSAAIKAVPDDIVEAAQIDGATGMRLFRSITIPTIRPTLVVVITTIAIGSLKTFDLVNVLGNGITKNDILASAFYSNNASNQPGLAGALAVMIFILVSPVIVFNVRQMKKADANR
ncbi:alpha-glucoside transport system permease protein [Nakamurella panacisegetis]|uniref:Alpha-glucoside transport system permease protein n=2 Tax=Nakamurella panacisegetis TaxID=1090615 RepID=A0A1H0JTK0_9ACTN|nr:alpha-glucoside transport system permease protein [Nakamurella panacisegetis]